VKKLDFGKFLKIEIITALMVETQVMMDKRNSHEIADNFIIYGY
jgi:hypothetical protein